MVVSCDPGNFQDVAYIEQVWAHLCLYRSAADSFTVGSLLQLGDKKIGWSALQVLVHLGHELCHRFGHSISRVKWFWMGLGRWIDISQASIIYSSSNSVLISDAVLNGNILKINTQVVSQNFTKLKLQRSEDFKLKSSREWYSKPSIKILTPLACIFWHSPPQADSVYTQLNWECSANSLLLERDSRMTDGFERLVSVFCESVKACRDTSIRKLSLHEV